VIGKVRDGAGGAKWTPRAIAPIQAIMTISFQNVDIHTRKGGDENGSDTTGTVANGPAEGLGFSR
jgi:hypothetical protein